MIDELARLIYEMRRIFEEADLPVPSVLGYESEHKTHIVIDHLMKEAAQSRSPFVKIDKQIHTFLNGMEICAIRRKE